MREPEKGFYSRYTWHSPSRQTVLDWRVGLIELTSCWEYEFPKVKAQSRFETTIKRKSCARRIRGKHVSYALQISRWRTFLVCPFITRQH